MYLSPWMKCVVDLPQPSLEHVRVDLRRREVRVPQHGLDRAQIRSSFEQVRRKGVPQYVRAQMGLNTGRRSIVLQNLPKRASAEAPGPALADEEPRWIFFHHEFRPGFRDITPDPADGDIAQWHDPFFIALSKALHVPLIQANVGDSQVDELRDTEARGIQHLDERAVAQPSWA